jgi:hypothetical protein
MAELGQRAFGESDRTTFSDEKRYKQSCPSHRLVSANRFNACLGSIHGLPQVERELIWVSGASGRTRGARFSANCDHQSSMRDDGFTSRPDVDGSFSPSALSVHSQQSEWVLTLRRDDAARDGASRSGQGGVYASIA